MNIKKRIKRELSSIDTPSPESVLPAKACAARKSYASWRARKRLTPVLAIIICVAIVTCTAFAAPAIVKYFNADILTAVEQLSQVPDGYVGIYTAEQLNDVRSNTDTNYILMNDISLKGYEWQPIHGYSGIFNGNGHIISELEINGDHTSEKLYFGLFGNTNGHFINLGIKNCSVSVSFGESPKPYDEFICVGAIAGSATFIGGCFSENTVINVSLANCDIEMDGGSTQTLLAGGVVGNVAYVDSCYSISDINVSDGVGFDVNVGLCAGSAFSCITSYSQGNISVTGESYSNVNTHEIATVSMGAYMPMILNEKAMDVLVRTIDKHYGDDGFTSKKIRSFYVPYSPDGPTASAVGNTAKKYLLANDSFGYITKDAELEQKWYFFDSSSDNGEKHMILAVISKAFGKYEKFLDFCAEYGIKCGMLNCYSFEKGQEITKDTLAGFDFDGIWAWRDGIATQKIFID